MAASKSVICSVALLFCCMGTSCNAIPGQGTDLDIYDMDDDAGTTQPPAGMSTGSSFTPEVTTTSPEPPSHQTSETSARTTQTSPPMTTGSTATMTTGSSATMTTRVQTTKAPAGHPMAEKKKFDPGSFVGGLVLGMVLFCAVLATACYCKRRRSSRAAGNVYSKVH